MKLFKAVIMVALLSILVGCASNNQLVFFTNTTIGLEVSSDPNGGSPAKFILGYKRQEGVIDPLIPDYEFVTGANGAFLEPNNGDTNIVMTPTGTAIPKGSRNNAHSVLAKMNFGATGGGADAAAAQFFATGKAAELIAQAPGISGALSGDPENNVVTSVNLTKGNETAVFAHLDDVYSMLADSTKKGDKANDAKEIKSKVDAIDNGIFKIAFNNYTWADATKTKLNKIEEYDVKKDSNEFANVYQYLTTLSNSRKVAKEAVLKAGIVTPTGALSEKEKSTMLNDIESFTSRHDEGNKLISSNEDVLAMINFVYNNVLLSTTTKENGE
jgi:hypothetical protein